MDISFRGVKRKAPILGIAVTVSMFLCVSAITDDSWDGCRPGDFGVGFRTVEKYDYSRTFREKIDDAGRPYAGEIARPIQICIWYPTAKAVAGDAVVFGEYVFPAPDDYRFFSFVSDIQNREIRNVMGVFGGNMGRGLDFQNRRMHAIRDADAYDSIFPVIIYHPGIQNSIAENAFLFEYLASHGYVVATTHSVGVAPGLPEPSVRNLEAMVRDREFVLAYLLDQPYIDRNRIGVVGRGTGASAAVVMQMRNDYIEAAALLDPSLGENHFYDYAAGHPGFDTWQADVPYLFFCRDDSALLQEARIDSFPYTERHMLTCDVTSPVGFTAYALAVEDGLDTAGGDAIVNHGQHARICANVRLFVDAYLKKSADIGDSLKAMGYHISAEQRPPTENQFRNLLVAMEIERALEVYDRLHALNPDRILLNEALMNQVGYALIGAQRVEDAVRIMRLNAETFPHSPNVWDSYADASLASGDVATAIKCYHRVLDILPADTVTDEQLKEQLRAIAEHSLQQLEHDDE